MDRPALVDEICDLSLEAKRNGIPRGRLYLSDWRLMELERELSQTSGHPAHIEGGEFMGMKVVRSSKPGMSIGL